MFPATIGAHFILRGSRMRFRKVSKWFAHHPWVATSFLVGIGTGMVLCLPILPVELPDSIAQIIGAGLGAGIAVGGAAWVAGNKARQHSAALRKLVELSSIIAVLSMEKLDAHLETLQDAAAPLPDDAHRALEGTALAYERCADALTSLVPAFQTDGELLLKLHFAIEAARNLALGCRLELKRNELRVAYAGVPDPFREDTGERVPRFNVGAIRASAQTFRATIEQM